jgi:hypothetical protein
MNVHEFFETMDRHKVSSLELAFLAGLEPSTLWRWKSGKSIPSPRAWKDACDALRVFTREKK